MKDPMSVALAVANKTITKSFGLTVLMRLYGFTKYQAQVYLGD